MALFEMTIDEINAEIEADEEAANKDTGSELVIDGAVDDAAGSDDAADDDLHDESGKETDEPEAGSDSSIEALASEMGWAPKDEFRGDSSSWVDAATYIRRGGDINESQRNHIKELKRSLREQKKMLSEMRGMFEADREAKAGDSMKQLKQQLREAAEEGDADLVEELTDKIMQASEKPAKKAADVDDGEVDNPEFEDWQEENRWYGTDAEMTRFADEVAGQYPGLSFKRLSNVINQKIREVFPEKFSAPKKADEPQRRRVSPVEGGRRTVKAEADNVKLTASQLAMAKEMEANGVMTVAEYKRDIAKMSKRGAR